MAEGGGWQLRGACRDAGVDGEIFFHPEGERGRPRADRDARAKRVCLPCPVLEACRRHALVVREPYGVWGGLSEDDRRALRNPAAARDAGPRVLPGCGRRTPRTDDHAG